MPGGFGSAQGSSPCPCGGGTYGSCCGPLHRGEQHAETAEQLMRSRYSAFVKAEVDYLLATHPQPELNAAERSRALRESCRHTRWLGLRVLQTSAGGANDAEGTVQFEARYRGGVLRETSLFERREGRWCYIRALALEP